MMILISKRRPIHFQWLDIHFEKVSHNLNHWRSFTMRFVIFYEHPITKQRSGPPIHDGWIDDVLLIWPTEDETRVRPEYIWTPHEMYYPLPELADNQSSWKQPSKQLATSKLCLFISPQ